MDLILRMLSGYSRFPVHEPGNPLAFIGLLLIKKVRHSREHDVEMLIFKLAIDIRPKQSSTSLILPSVYPA